MNDMTTPDVITRYLQAADAKEFEAAAACFIPDGTVLDEGRTYRGPAEIAGWRRAATRWTYTTEVTGSEPVSAREYRVRVHASGDFPGGQADLAYTFRLDGDAIAALAIVE
jgi:ketosteroid isomerase-like protein